MLFRSEAGFGPEILSTCQLNFADIDVVGAVADGFDFVLADLGVSSMQIDNPERGFTYKQDGKLDLRLDPTQGVSAADRIRHIGVDELEGMMVENADEPYAREIAKAIVSHNRRGDIIDTTTKLKSVIEEALEQVPASERTSDLEKKTCQRVFQALRIDVNNEFEVLDTFLEKLPEVLKPSRGCCGCLSC